MTDCQSGPYPGRHQDERPATVLVIYPTGLQHPSGTTAPGAGEPAAFGTRIDVLWRMKGSGWVRSSMTSERWSITTAGRAAPEISEQIMTTRRFIVDLGANGKPQIDKLASGVDARAAACGTVRQFTHPVSATVLTYENGQLFPTGTWFTDEREPVAWVNSKMLDQPRPQVVPEGRIS